LPPGFPPVRIEGKLYWDGGLYSNTSLETVLDDVPRVSTSCFMVDLWFAHGDELCTPDQVESRRKEVMFASRSERHIETYSETHNLRRRLRALYVRLPPELRQNEDIAQLARGGCSPLHSIRVLSYTIRRCPNQQLTSLCSNKVRQLLKRQDRRRQHTVANKWRARHSWLPKYLLNRPLNCPLNHRRAHNLS